MNGKDHSNLSWRSHITARPLAAFRVPHTFRLVNQDRANRANQFRAGQDHPISTRINSSAKRVCIRPRMNSSKNMALKPPVESTDPRKVGGGGQKGYPEVTVEPKPKTRSSFFRCGAQGTK